MENDGISDYSGSNRHRDISYSGKLRMTAQIIHFREYQNPRDLAPMHGDTETSLAKLSHMAAEVFNALTIGTAAEEYSVPEKTCVIIEDKLYRAGSLGNLAVKIWRLEHC
jgi:hypothetical protein